MGRPASIRRTVLQARRRSRRSVERGPVLRASDLTPPLFSGGTGIEGLRRRGARLPAGRSSAWPS